jgi:PPOX class probable FMN-dependent enzyme
VPLLCTGDELRHTPPTHGARVSSIGETGRMQIPGRVETIEQLESMYRKPGAAAVHKVLPAINEGMAAFIDRCSFLVLATGDGISSLEASPRGGPAGFVRRLDDRHVAVPDLNGNNRLDSLRNIVTFPWAALLMVVPGQEETLRINGPAALSTDPDLLAGFTKELRPPKLAVVIEVAEVYGHCAKAFKRGNMWRPETWLSDGRSSDLASMYACVWNLDETAVRDDLAKSYVAELAAD